MFTKLLGLDSEPHTVKLKEGDLFKVIVLYGKSFEIRYGFYEECDRYTQHAEPVEIYPNFKVNPQYTDDGIPFVTAMQNPCNHFEGKLDENSVCGDCAFYRHGDELLGICGCFKNRKTSYTRGGV